MQPSPITCIKFNELIRESESGGGEVCVCTKLQKPVERSVYTDDVTGWATDRS